MSNSTNKLQELLQNEMSFNSTQEFEDAFITLIREAEENKNRSLEKEAIEHFLGLTPGSDYSYKKFDIIARQSILEYTISKEASNFFSAIDYYKNYPDEVDADQMDSFLQETWEYLFSLLWAFKFTTPNLPLSLDYPLDDIDEANKIMHKYYELFEFCLSPIYKVKVLQQIFLGNVEDIKHYYEEWKNTETDDMEDCPACVLDDEIHYHYFLGEYDVVLEKSKPILNNEQVCGEVPELTYFAILNSQIKLGLLNEAKELFTPAKNSLIAHNDPTNIIDLIEVAFRLGLDSDAKELIDLYEIPISRLNNVYWQMRYHTVLSVISEDNYNIALELASKFDERNGNDYYKNYLKTYIEECSSM